jgi:superfamily I DNA and/or RNA helicase
MERLMQLEPDWSVQLIDQYRMHAAIMGFSSAEMYADSLRAAPAVAQHTLADLPGVHATPLTTTPLRFVDTAGANYDEVAAGVSRHNPSEAELALRYVERLVSSGVSPDQIAIITPYSAQVRALRELRELPVEINSIDGFQGREKEAVIISLVRANRQGDIGFLADTRRMNVALTRARRKLIIIGDSATVATHPFYARLLDYCDAAGAYRSVWEESDL